MTELTTICPTCETLRRKAEFVSLYDWRDGAAAWEELKAHLATHESEASNDR